ncbi:MAG: single-stranded-DNA-specific exonuclease RecJ [Candidatus Nomurabacteria bacterium]|nr:single-stranded-DNA-specific exonuclease RecJ [Candidatus Nomurabacteria bacterium]
MTSSELLDKLLEKRGLHTKEDKESFLNPNYERDILDPFLMRDMQKSCERILSAIQNNEKILIYADYDCDGIPGAVILNDLFEKLEYKNFDVYIPQRNSEGYGLNTESVERMKEDGVKVLITIDLGITAIEEVADAQKHGIDVIVTDHHLPHAEIPKAFAILNPKCDDYPEKMLCGAGVAFKLAQGFLKYLKGSGLSFSSPAELASLKQSSVSEKQIPTPFIPIEIQAGWDKWLLDMAGLATLSDMVPLLGENRAIAYFGMKVLKKSPRPGLKALLRKTKIAQEYLTEDDIGFMITPRLNAASRMDDPRRAFELLATKDTAEGETLANHLSNINDERKNLVKSIMRDINKKFEKREHTEVIVIGNPTWKVGVLGLIAGKITDEYKRPAFVWGRDENDVIKGSCRSDGSVSVVELMTETKEHFTEFGGHEGAGGFSVHNDKIHFLEEALCKSFIKVFESGKRQDLKGAQGLALRSDLTLTLDDISMQNWKEIEKMAPFGLANPKPMFLFENIPVTAMKKFGKAEEHLEFMFTNSRGQKIKAISFFSTPESFTKTPAVGEPISLLATFDLSRFAGRVELRLRVEDII